MKNQAERTVAQVNVEKANLEKMAERALFRRLHDLGFGSRAIRGSDRLEVIWAAIDYITNLAEAGEIPESDELDYFMERAVVARNLQIWLNL